MKYTLREIFDLEGVPYVTRGANVARDHINIRCPWCGEEDPSEHLGISLVNGAWGCWRDRAHRGIRPHRLLLKLLGDRAQAYLPQPTASDLGPAPGLSSRFDGPTEEGIAPLDDLDHIWECFPRIDTSEEALPYRQYLEARGISLRAAARYDLRAGFMSDRWRVLFPLRWDGHVVGWTGRAIGLGSPRYRLSGAQVPLVFRRGIEAQEVWVVEGPFDGLKLSLALDRLNIRSVQVVAVLGTAVSRETLQRLRAIPGRFTLLWDADAWDQSIEAALSWGMSVDCVPEGAKDFGELPLEVIQSWILKRSSCAISPTGRALTGYGMGGESLTGTLMTGPSTE